MIKMQIGSWLLAVFSVSTVTRYDRTTKEDGEDLGRKYCWVPFGKVEAAHHVPLGRQYYGSNISELWDCTWGSYRWTVAGGRDSDSPFPAGSDRVESLFCCLLKRFGFVFLIQCSSTAKAVNCPKQGTDDTGFWISDISEAFGGQKYSVN